MLQVYATDRSLAHRLDVLDTLALAARELSGVTDDAGTGDVGSGGASGTHAASGVGTGAGGSAGAGAAAATGSGGTGSAAPMQQVGRVTRRWGKPKVAPKAPTANAFAPHAATFFFPLLRGFTSRVTGLDLLDKASDPPYLPRHPLRPHLPL